MVQQQIHATSVAIIPYLTFKQPEFPYVNASKKHP